MQVCNQSRAKVVYRTGLSQIVSNNYLNIYCRKTTNRDYCIIFKNITNIVQKADSNQKKSLERKSNPIGL